MNFLRRISKARFAAAALVAVVLSTTSVFAQTDVTTGRIAGQVVDQDGQPLPGATVEAKNKGTGLTLSQTSDGRGGYRIVNLPVGTYDVKAALSGFRSQDRTNVVVTLGSAVTADFKLGLSTVAETVTVTGEVPSVETTQTASQTTVDQNAIKSLPSNGRNFTNFVLLTPNAQTDTQRGNLALGGQRGINTNITVDGVDFNNSFFGGASGSAEGRAPFSISQESVREFQVIQNGASVEFGRSSGGFVNVITKSGTNDFHGSAFYYVRPKSLVANFSNPATPGVEANSLSPKDQKTDQYGASFGGAAVKDKLFFFGSFEQQKQTTAVPIDAPVLDQDIFTKYPAYASDSSYNFTQDGRVFFARLDFQATDKHRFLIRGNFNHYEGVNATNTGATHASGYNGLEGNDTATYVASWSGMFSSSFLNDMNLQYSKDDTPREDLAPTLPEVQVGSARYGGIAFLPISGTTDRKSIGDTVTYLAGNHAAKLGFDYNDTGMDQIFKGNWRGVFIFRGTSAAATKANFIAGKWDEYRQFVGLNGLTADEAGRFNERQKETAFFIQDQWFAGPALTLTLGVRYERLNNPDSPVLNLRNQIGVDGNFTYAKDGRIPDVNDQWSPRLSIAWSPEKNARSVVRFSMGRYWARTPELLWAQLYTSNGLQGTQITIFKNGSSTDNPGAPTNPLAPGWGPNFRPVGVAQITGSPTTIATPGVSIIDPNFTNPHTDKASLGLEREFFGVALGIEGIWAKTSNLERLGDVNLAAASVDPVSGLTIYSTTRPNKAYGRVIIYKSDGRSRFGSVSMTARKNFAGGFRAFGSVTWSEDRDNDDNERNFSGIFSEDVNNLEGQYGYSGRDIKWRLLGNVSYERNLTKSIGLFASALFNYQTGRPYTAFTNVDVNKDTVGGTDRPTVNGNHIARNTFRQPDFYTLDLRVGASFEIGPGRASIFAEVFNLTNTANRSTSNTIYGVGPDPRADFGTLNGYTQTPRTVQLAARYDF
ncbi:MAG: TonB-dependent receptor [Thermoanaerobaculia bacterium]